MGTALATHGAGVGFMTSALPLLMMAPVPVPDGRASCGKELPVAGLFVHGALDGDPRGDPDWRGEPCSKLCRGDPCCREGEPGTWMGTGPACPWTRGSATA